MGPVVTATQSRERLGGRLSVLPSRVSSRRWPAASLAVLVACASAAAFVLLWLSAGERRAVLAVARPVRAGQQLAAEDLTETRVSADPSVALVPASEARDVVGQTTRVGLVPGSLLSPDQLGAGDGLEPGEALAGMSLDRSRLPAGNVDVGDRVRVVEAGPPGTGADPAAAGTGYAVVAEGRVVSVDEDDETGSGEVAVTLATGADAAAAVAAAVAGDRASLLVVAP